MTCADVQRGVGAEGDVHIKLLKVA
jgi:hypothetical protein